MIRRYSVLWSLFLLIGVMGGCQAILQFDEDKLDTGSGGKGGTTTPQGGGGHGGNATTASQGGGGHGGGGNGGSGGCATPADCPDPGSECLQNTCEGGVCGTTPVGAGEPATKQTIGDCKVAVCDGSGGITTQADDEDVLDDGLDCTEDICVAGMPGTNAVTAGTPCDDGGGKMCNGLGACVQCLVNADCGIDAPKCSGEVCVPASCDDGVHNGDETDTDCGGSCGASCAPGDTCAIASDCAEGVCTNGACAAATCTDGVENGDETDTDCGGGACPKCGPAKGCDVNADCAGNQCTGVGGTCVPNCSDGVKNNAETGVDCGGTCPGCPAGGPCGQDTDCEATAYCAAMTCTPKKPNGQACGAANQCTSGVCVDGVCCNNACNFTCQACNLAGAVGTCTAIAAGQDPMDECAGAQVCDGAFACKKSIGQACAASSECAQGNCVDGVCCNNACGGTCQACNLAGSVGTCTNIPNGQDPANECANGVCSGTGTCKSDNGQPCATASACVSNNCVDGVCCNNACNGTCQACNLAGSAGTCTNIPNGQDPGNECVGATSCNGAGACAKLANGTPCSTASDCQSSFCVDGVCCSTACNGLCRTCNGTFTVEAPGTCGTIECADPDNECPGSQLCQVNGTCGFICL